MNTPKDKKEEHITIYLEANPNPHSLKFVANKFLIPDGMNFDFSDTSDTTISPLAEELFSYPFVTRVFFSSNFITITKKETIAWIEIQNTIKIHIKNFIETGNSLIKKEFLLPLKKTEEDTEIIQEIKKILEEYIKPAVEQDGGAISFHSYVDGKVNVILQGACSGCPSSTVTLKAGIENLMKKMLPDHVSEVEAI